MIAGRTREMGLGPVQRVGLEARKAVYGAYRLKRQGVDPLDARREKRWGR